MVDFPPVGELMKEYNYILDIKDSLTRVIDGLTGQPIEYYTDAGNAINWCIGTGGVDGTLKSIRVKGAVNVATQVLLKKNIFLHWDILDFNALDDVALLIDDGTDAVYNLWLEGKVLRNAKTGLKNAQQDEGSPKGISYDIHIDIGLIRDAKVQAVTLKYLIGDIWIDYLRTDNVAVANTHDWLIQLFEVAGLTVDTISLTKPAKYGIQFYNVNALWADSIYTDSAGNDGIFLELVANAHVDRLVASLCSGYGVVLRYPKSVMINQINTFICGGGGCKIEYTGDYATTIGIVHANHCGATPADGCALRFVDAKYVAIRALQAIDDMSPEVMKHAIVEEGTSDYNQISALNTFGLTSTTIVSSALHSQYPAWLILPSSITVTASPFAYRNLDVYREDVIVQGGTVSAIEFSRDNSNWYDTGVTAGLFHLLAGDYLRVTYSVAPTMTRIPL